MRLALGLLLSATVACTGCLDVLGSAETQPTFIDPSLPVEERTAQIVEAMSLEEKVEQMHGLQLPAIDELFHTLDNQRLGVPRFKMVDGPRGVGAGRATAFPVGMARGATWDPELEERVGEAIGLEAAAKGANVILAPTINVLRHPAWGRAQETYGEDPLHIGRMGVAFIRGAQRHVIASAKHFALNSIEDTRFSVSVEVDERTLREVYLPHFRMAVDAGVGSVMSAYNRVNGTYCAENAPLLRDILKDEWGFDGFVESDWILGTRSTVPSALAGLDIEMPSAVYFGEALRQAVVDGEVPTETLDEAVTRSVRQKLRFGLDRASDPDPAVVESDEHLALALEVARQSIVMLKNDAALPIDRESTARVALVGPLIDRENIGDEGSSAVTPSEITTLLEGMQASAGNAQLSSFPGDTLSPSELAEIASADVAVVAVGLTALDEGENLPTGGGDRDSLQLSSEQQAMISAVAAANPRTIVVLEGGSAILVDPWVDEIEALLMAWYPGQRGGQAIAEVLFGDVNPSGKLPLTFPRSAEQLPTFDHQSDEVRYQLLHGYRHVEAAGEQPRYAFGHGLSYSSFSLSSLALSDDSMPAGGSVRLDVSVRNDSARAGDEVVQLYVEPVGSGIERAPLELRDFSRLSLAPGESRQLSFTLAASQLAHYDVSSRSWRVERIEYRVSLGTSASARPLSAVVQVQ